MSARPGHSRDTPVTESTWPYSRRPAPLEREPWLGFDTDAVVHRSTNPLLAAEIALSCLHGDVPEKELDLVQFSTRSMTQLGTRTPQIMRCYLGKSEFSRYCFTTCQTNRSV